MSWKGTFARKKHKKIWMAVPILLFWTVWRGRNRVVFDNVEITALGLKISSV